jgi:hypothetical protein
VTRAPAVATVLFTAALALSGLTGVTSADPRPGLTVTVASNTRPEFVSGGDVLIRVSTDDHVRVHLGRADVTSSFTSQPDGTLLGVVRGLRDGANTITATAARGRHASVRVVNHPRSGPVFSGRQQVPFFCQTEAFGLAPAQQPKCDAPTVVRYAYRTTSGQFKALADPASRPADLATASVEGVTVPYVVRVEVGVIDRAVYQTAALYDGHDPSPVAPETSWNGRLVYNFGGGCNSGYRQGGSTGDVLVDLFLSQGYAVASSSLNVLDNNCSTIISAEAAMMVKEHFLETYGPARHTIGWGGSGGAIQQYDIADAYPGILDGIVPGISFPDPLTTTASVTDCGLLNAFFARGGFTPEQQRAVSGYNTYDTCTSWGLTFLNRTTATGSCDPIIPVSIRWSPQNPDGLRCAASEQWVNQLGRDPRNGFARAVLDNTGVQYGLRALKAGQISPAQFAALNAGIGGYDFAGRPIPTRTSADPRGLAAAYGSDLLNGAHDGLRYTPVIDQRTYLDLVPIGDIHSAEMSFIMRDRLRRANGTSANQVIIATSPDPAQAAAAAAYQLDAMDRWLTAIADDGSHRDRPAKVIANKPRDLADGCYVSVTERIAEPLTYPSSGRCGQLYPVGANPRLVAGANLAMTTVKCRLKPLDFRDYPVPFTAEEKSLLRQAFPTGVCDYNRKGVSERPSRGTWQTF